MFLHAAVSFVDLALSYSARHVALPTMRMISVRIWWPVGRVLIWKSQISCMLCWGAWVYDMLKWGHGYMYSWRPSHESGRFRRHMGGIVSLSNGIKNMLKMLSSVNEQIRLSLPEASRNWKRGFFPQGNTCWVGKTSSKLDIYQKLQIYRYCALWYFERTSLD